MKKIFSLAAIAMLFSMSAQSYKHSIRLHLWPLAMGNVALSYEYGLASNMTIGATFAFTPNIPTMYPSIIDKVTTPLLDLASIYGVSLASTKYYTMSIAPEFRLYTKREAMNSFYMSVKPKYSYFSAPTIEGSMDDYNGQPAAAMAEMKNHYFGLMIGIGNQWSWDSGFTLDILWIGLSAGASKTWYHGYAVNGNNEIDFYTAADEVDNYFSESNTSSDVPGFIKFDGEATANDLTITGMNFLPMVNLLSFRMGYSFGTVESKAPETTPL